MTTATALHNSVAKTAVSGMEVITSVPGTGGRVLAALDISALQLNDGVTVDQLPAVTAAGNVPLVASNGSGELGTILLSAIQSYLASQAQNAASASPASALVSGDQVLLIRNGALMLAPTSLFTSTAGSSGAAT